MSKAVIFISSFIISMGLAANGYAATEVELKNIAARVIVTPEARSDVVLTVKYGKADVPKVMLTPKGNRLVADGGLKAKRYNCQGTKTVSFDNRPKINVEDLPIIFLKVPMYVSISSKSAMVFGEVGDSHTLDLGLGGCGDWKIGNVKDKAQLAIGGSGEAHLGNVGQLDVAIGGGG
jgi:hypothetical protein